VAEPELENLIVVDKIHKPERQVFSLASQESHHKIGKLFHMIGVNKLVSKVAEK
jgi:hypothetical protein